MSHELHEIEYDECKPPYGPGRPSPFEVRMAKAKKLIADRTCENCIDRKGCMRHSECYTPGSGFYRKWRGKRD